MKTLCATSLLRMTAATAQPSSAEDVAAPIVLPARLIQEGEEVVLALKPSGFFVLLISAPFILAVAVLAVAAYALDTCGIVPIPLQQVALVCAVACLARLLVGCMQWLSRIYVLTNRRIIRVRGVLRISIFECPLHRIQNTVLSLSVSERVFALGTVLFATAGTGRMEAAWAMIARPIEVHEIVITYIRRAQGPNGPKDV